MVQTVLGNIKPEELGHCQCHEHVFIRKGRSYEINPNLYMDSLDKSTKELNEYRLAGGCSIVDAQPIGCGRMVENLVKASSESKINIVASTGFHKLIFYPADHWIFELSMLEFSNIMIEELTKGMYINCDKNYPKQQILNKAGMIKVACDKNGIDKTYLKLFEAAARAAKETGFPIQCHTELDPCAGEIVEFFIDNGINPEKIIIAHLDRTEKNIKSHLKVCDLGAYVQYDTIGRSKYHSDEKEVELIKEMIQNGFENNILLGLDTTRARLKNYNGDIGLSYILESFIPLMRKKQISEKVANKFLVINPSKALCNSKNIL